MLPSSIEGWDTPNLLTPLEGSNQWLNGPNREHISHPMIKHPVFEKSFSFMRCFRLRDNERITKSQ
jgi:hypothetical protein